MNELEFEQAKMKYKQAKHEFNYKKITAREFLLIQLEYSKAQDEYMLYLKEVIKGLEAQREKRK